MIELKGIGKKYKKGRKVKALRNVNISFPNKGMVFISGASGSGKTTLLNIIAGIIKPTEGIIEYSNCDKDSMSYIFQEYNLLNDLTVKDNIILASKIKGKDLSTDEINSFFEDIGMLDMMNSHPDELSGGQQQRVAIARAVLMNSNVLLADEPTGSLDDELSEEIMKILKEFSKERLVIIVSHNKELVAKYSDRIIKICDGQITSDETINSIESKSNNTIAEAKAKKRFTLGYYLKLGFKYIKFLSIKLYISILALAISFSILFSALSLIMFDSNNAYDTLRKDNNETFIVLRKSDDDGGLPFSSSEMNKISECFDVVVPTCIFYSSTLFKTGFHQGTDFSYINDKIATKL